MEWEDVRFPGISVEARPTDWRFDTNVVSVWTILVFLMAAFGLKNYDPDFRGDTIQMCLLAAIHGVHNGYGVVVDDADVVAD